MDVREKLVEICFHEFCIVAGDSPCGCDGCPYGKYGSDVCYEEYKKDKFGNLEKTSVTVQEWISVKEPPKEKGTYIVCTDNGGVLLGHWYGTAWNAGGGAKKHLAYWMEMPQPPKGE